MDNKEYEIIKNTIDNYAKAKNVNYPITFAPKQMIENDEPLFLCNNKIFVLSDLTQGDIFRLVIDDINGLYNENKAIISLKNNEHEYFSIINNYNALIGKLEPLKDMINTEKVPVFKQKQFIGLEKKLETKANELEDILNKIAFESRSNAKDGFYVKTRINAIHALAKEKGIEPLCKDKHCLLYGKLNPDNKNIPVLVSSHADIVPNIKNVYAKREDDSFQGTFDNLGTNAAALHALLYNDLPDNVFIAFTDEEETLKCLGAISANRFIKEKLNTKPFFIALDVTHEGYDENKIFSIENMDLKVKNRKSIKPLLENYFDNEENNNYIVVPKNNKDIDLLNKDNYSDFLSEPDEGMFMGERQSAISYCLPCTGQMHADSGLFVKTPTFIGYMDNLEHFLLSINLTKEEIREKYPTQNIFNTYLCLRNEKINENEYNFNLFEEPFSGQYSFLLNDEFYDFAEEEEEYSQNIIDECLYASYENSIDLSSFLEEVTESLGNTISEEELIMFYEDMENEMCYNI